MTVVNIALVSGSDDGPATVGVDVTWRGETRNILVRVVRESEAWRVANISYGSGGTRWIITARSPDGEAHSPRADSRQHNPPRLAFKTWLASCLRRQAKA